MTEKISGIYAIRNKINGLIYIGQSRDIHKRFTAHLASLRNNHAHNPHLQHSWNKYGESNFDFDIIERCPVTDLDEREKYWISYYDSTTNGYNILAGGNSHAGYHLSDETKQKISCKNKGRVKTPEQIEKAKQTRKLHNIPAHNIIDIVCLNTGEVFHGAKAIHEKYPDISSSQVYDNISKHTYGCKTKLGYKMVFVRKSEYDLLSDGQIADMIDIANNHARHKQVSQEAHNRAGNKIKGIPRAPDVVNKMSEGLRQYYQTHRSKSCKAVVCMSTGEIFESILQAHQQYPNISISQISGCCHHRNHIGGVVDGQKMIWMFLNEYEQMSIDQIDIYKTQAIDKAINRNYRKRRVICVTTGLSFDSLTEAGKYYNLSPSYISSVCGNSTKTTHGLAWQYQPIK